MNLEEELEKIRESIQKMTPEQIEKEVLHLNGIIGQETFDKVINELKEKEVLNQEHISYFLEEYNIKLENFNDVFNYLDTYAENKGYTKEEINDFFPEYKLYFKYKDTYFIWRLLIGQGSDESLYLAKKEDCNKLIELSDKIDKEIKFYKRLDKKL